MQKDSAQAKISSKVVGGGATFFDSPCTLNCNYTKPASYKYLGGFWLTHYCKSY